MKGLQANGMSTPTSDDTPIDPAVGQALAGLPQEFDDFVRVFEREIRPALQAREHERISAADTARKTTWGGGLVAAIGIAASLLVFRVPQLAILSGVAGAAIAGFGRMPISRVGKQAKSLIVEPVAANLGLGYVDKPGQLASIYDFKSAKLIGSWDRSDFEDHLSGERNGVGFEFYEAHLEEKRTTTDSKGRTQTSWVTIFRGQCLRFKFHKIFYGRTLVTRDAGFFNRFGGGGGLQRAILESPEFEKAFEVYTTDQVESRFLLTPDLMQKLNELEQTFRGKRLRCAFAGGEMLIAVEGTDLFEPGSMFTPLDDPQRMRDLLNDFAAVFHLIDSVSKARDQEEQERDEPPPTKADESPWGRFLNR